MARLYDGPAVIQDAGTGNKIINEFFGRVNSATQEVSVARMISPPGWSEPGQKPEFNEYTVVLKGKLKVETHEGELLVSEGQAILAPANEWIRYSTPEGAEYIAVCVPAFSPDLVHRDEI